FLRSRFSVLASEGTLRRNRGARKDRRDTCSRRSLRSRRLLLERAHRQYGSRFPVPDLSGIISPGGAARSGSGAVSTTRAREPVIRMISIYNRRRAAAEWRPHTGARPHLVASRVHGSRPHEGEHANEQSTSSPIG